jgi:hypothetical protein
MSWGNRVQLYTDDAGGSLDMGLGDSHTTALNIHQLQAGTWYHVVLTWNSGSHSVCVNGTLKVTGAYSALSALGSYAHIGGVGSDSNPQSWSGAIDEVKIWNRALNATEIQSEFALNQPPLAPPANPSSLMIQIK